MSVQRKYDFQPGTKASSSQVDEEFDNLISGINENEENINNHKADTDNPHLVTPEQIGALPLTGGNLTGDLNGQSVSVKNIEIRNSAVAPYIDFSNDESTDFDARITLVGDNDLVIEEANLTINGGLSVSDSIHNNGINFHLGDGDQVTRGNTGESRALVKNAGGQLVINYLNDFYGGVHIHSDVSFDRLKGESDPNVLYFGDSNLPNGGLFVAKQSSEGHTLVQGVGSSLKLLKSNEGVQSRNLSDTAYATMGASAFNVGSTRDIKKNIVPASEKATGIINETTIYHYNYDNELDSEVPHTGVIYDESPWQIVDPAGRGVDTYSMVSLAWKAIQELSAENQALKARIEALETKSL